MMGNRIKEYRQKKGLSQTELAYKTGVSQRYIAFIEANQRTPSFKLALRISKALGETVDTIFLP
ncbi:MULTISPECIES: helix-turn-helix transcriptional regulator [unclassified Megasphaera]|jgi:putative transcriptional regulator|uniref:helix-turn-helix transcriptional regulator n=2 Tax=Megasphaera TaxID=906 RepID=UPI001EF9F7E1|nr:MULTISPECIES: helix-turn-helix transcriptional regulator [unclassified Megasphaera]